LTYLALLLGLSLTDATFAGFRAGAGRNPRIHKLDYTIVTCWSGLFAGLAAALLAALGALAYLLAASEGSPFAPAAIAQLDAAAQPLVHVYAVFATVLLSVVLFWTYPRRRTRELAVVLILGPCTLLRPYWIVGGAAWALSGVGLSLAALIAFVAALQLGIEPLLNVWQARAQRLRMQPLLADGSRA
jgi:hypothetical protein